MARAKGMGNLQREKGGRWTLRVCVNGKRFCRSTGTRDRERAERFAERFLSPLGLGTRRLPLCEAWFEYERSPNRRDLAPSTLQSKRQVWMHFARWMEKGHPEVSELGQLTAEMVGEYLRCLRTAHCATTYNNHVCVLREICRILSPMVGLSDDPWAGVRLLCDDSHPRRDFSIDELQRILAAAKNAKTEGNGGQWHLLFLIGIYTGLRLGDCCTLEWASVDLERRVIQVIPRKTRKHAHGRPVTIPIHPVLDAALRATDRACGGEGGDRPRAECVLPSLSEWYLNARWRVSDGLSGIFRKANIVTSVRLEGRRNRAPEATFHSLRHTFVSLAANAGVPLPVVQSIVGHASTAMTRHYYHETEIELWRAVEAIPALGAGTEDKRRQERPERVPSVRGSASIVRRLDELEELRATHKVSSREYREVRSRILAEI